MSRSVPTIFRHPALSLNPNHPSITGSGFGVTPPNKEDTFGYPIFGETEDGQLVFINYSEYDGTTNFDPEKHIPEDLPAIPIYTEGNIPIGKKPYRPPPGWTDLPPIWVDTDIPQGGHARAPLNEYLNGENPSELSYPNLVDDHVWDWKIIAKDFVDQEEETKSFPENTNGGETPPAPPPNGNGGGSGGDPPDNTGGNGYIPPWHNDPEHPNHPDYVDPLYSGGYPDPNDPPGNTGGDADPPYHHGGGKPPPPAPTPPSSGHPGPSGPPGNTGGGSGSGSGPPGNTGGGSGSGSGGNGGGSGSGSGSGSGGSGSGSGGGSVSAGGTGGGGHHGGPGPLRNMGGLIERDYNMGGRVYLTPEEEEEERQRKRQEKYVDSLAQSNVPTMNLGSPKTPHEAIAPSGVDGNSGLSLGNTAKSLAIEMAMKAIAVKLGLPGFKGLNNGGLVEQEPSPSLMPFGLSSDKMKSMQELSLAKEKFINEEKRKNISAKNKEMRLNQIHQRKLLS